jgi:hypothetical protein
MVVRDRLFQLRRLGRSSEVDPTALLTSMLRIQVVAYPMEHRALKFQRSLESQHIYIRLMIRESRDLRTLLLMDFP